jgi:hypothetical protein
LNSPLIDYALKGLAKCWMPDLGRWSHAYLLDGRSPANQSVPHSEVFYTLNVLLGLSRLQRIPAEIDTAQIFSRNAALLLHLPVRKYGFGMALWAGAKLRCPIPRNISDHLASFLSERNNWKYLRAQDLGMILVGMVAQAQAGSDTWAPMADALFSYILSAYSWPSGLFADAASGLRRRFASFASQVYLTLACYIYGEWKGERRAVELANHCCRKLISLQGPNGEWPWFYDASSGIVVDFYEVYSVHQIGMAPAFLRIAEHNGVREARDALVKGFSWIFGDNQLGISMLSRTSHLTIRSQVRRGELHTDKWRAVRAISNSALRRSSGLVDPSQLDLRRECRSYELGWILWSFGGSSDYQKLTHHTQFLDEIGESQSAQAGLSL